MRKELEFIQKIDLYLEGKLSAKDKAAFEKQMEADTELKKEVKLQQDLIKGVELLKIKKDLKRALTLHKQGIHFLKWGYLSLNLLFTSVALTGFIGKKNGNNAPTVEKVTIIQKDSLSELPAQDSFVLNTTDSTVEERMKPLPVAQNVPDAKELNRQIIVSNEKKNS